MGDEYKTCLEFYGCSDDLFECDGSFREEINCYDGPGIYKLEREDGLGMLVVGHYDLAGNGCWTIGVTPIDEDIGIPQFDIGLTNVVGNEYSPMLHVSSVLEYKVSVVKQEDED